MKNFTVLGGKISGRSYNIYAMLWNVQKMVRHSFYWSQKRTAQWLSPDQ